MKKFTSILLSFVLIFTLSSCRTKSDTPAQTTSTTKEDITLKVWNLFDDSDVFAGQIQVYQSKFPNIKISYKKFTNIEEYEDLLINEIAQGEGPDVFAIHNSWVDKHLKKLTPFPVGDTTQPLNPQIFDDTFFASASQDLIRDGQIYGIPLSIDSLALYYNKQLFRDNVPNTDKPADTWDEIKKQTELLTKENNSLERFAVAGMAMGRADNIIRAYDILLGLMLEYGVEMFNTASNKAVFARQNGVIESTGKPFFPFLEALQLFSSFGNPAYKNYSWNSAITSLSKNKDEIAPFLRGKVGMMFGYSFLYDDLVNMRTQLKTVGESVINESDIGVIEFPQILSFAETGKRDALANYFPLTVSRNAEHPEYAWDFIQYLASNESMADYHEKTHKPTARKDLVDEQMLEPIYGVFARQASYAKSFPSDNKVDPSFLELVMKQAMDEVVKNKQELSKISLKAQEQVNCQLEKQLKMAEVDVNCLEI